MPRTSSRALTRLERLEAIVQPDARCPACGVLPHPVRALVVSLAAECRTEGHRPLKKPATPPCAVCNRWPFLPLIEVWSDEVEDGQAAA